MTGTAVAVGEQLREFYRLEIAVIPPNQPCVRIDEPDRLFAAQGQKEKAVADHLGDRYVQHNPDAPDGAEAFIGYVTWLRGQYPHLKLDIKQVIAEGDMVVTHSHLDLEPGSPDNPGRALADFFRLENGKVVEHWDVIQDVPKTSANDNGMF